MLITNHYQLFRIISESVEFSLRTAPVFINLYKGFQENLLAEEFFQSLAAFSIHLLERHTLVTNDDALLGITLHVDDGIDVDAGVILLESLHPHLYGIRNLLIIIEKYLFSNNFRNEEAGWLIGQLVLVEERR